MQTVVYLIMPIMVLALPLCLPLWVLVFVKQAAFTDVGLKLSLASFGFVVEQVAPDPDLFAARLLFVVSLCPFLLTVDRLAGALT